MLAELFEKHLIDDILIGFLVLCTFVFQHINACIFFQRCQGNNARSIRSDRSGSGVQLGLQSPLVPQPLSGLIYHHRSPKLVQIQIVPPATRARMKTSHFRSLTKL